MKIGWAVDISAIAVVVHGGWSDWSGWGGCSKTCGSGTQTRTRRCDNPEPGPGGDQCSGSSTESRTCNTASCPRNCSPYSNNWSCCSSYNRCNEGEGDCDSDSDCSGNLVCGSNNCRGGSSGLDCCEQPQRSKYYNYKYNLLWHILYFHCRLQSLLQRLVLLLLLQPLQ